jgi:hypothetical protein
MTSEAEIEAAKSALLTLHKRVLRKKADHVFVIQGGDFNVFLDALLNGAIAIERAALSAASAVRSEGAVKVRDLKWGAIGAARQIFSADTAMGEYTVEYYEEPGVGAGWSAVYQDGHELGDYATEAEVKSAAQEHYTNAVLSAITSPVQTREEPEWVEQARTDWFGAVAHGMMPSRKWADKYAPLFLALLSQPEPKGDKA